MIQKVLRSTYNIFDMLFGGGGNGKQIQNGRKLTLVFSSILFFFICAVIGSIWFAPLLGVVTNVVFTSTIVGLVGLYIGGNVVSKKYDNTTDACKFDPKKICEVENPDCKSSQDCKSK